MDIQESALPQARAISTAGPIETDVTCRRCGYNLRGLLEEGLCPECGTAVVLSTRGDLLRYADPDWVETMARGVKFILWGLLLATVLGFLGGFLILRAGQARPTGPTDRRFARRLRTGC